MCVIRFEAAWHVVACQGEYLWWKGVLNWGEAVCTVFWIVVG